ncbi:MAG: serine/threonine-protein kinase, partial [Gemmatimonadota bacterium]
MDRLYERARALDPEARTAFVVAAGREAPRLRDEVLSLLEQADAAEEFFQFLSDAMPSPAPASSASDLSIGHTIGHYEIRGRIGAGGMGTVYHAFDTRLDREVALKFLPAHLSAEPEARERLLVEARAAAALEHANVCGVYEIGEADDGQPFIAMALCDGDTLKTRLQRGPFPPAEAAQVAAQIARGLAAAHKRGILHRDVKPGNVMIASDGTVKLLDFGLAKSADATLTQSGPTPGTIAYMSPEQARGDPVDARTDLWSLGVVLYEMLTGTRPFRGGNDRAFVQAILHEDPEPVTTLRPGTPDALERIVERLLRKDPADRYGNAEELLADLAQDAMARVRLSSPRLRVVAGAAVVLAGVALFLAIRSTGDSAGRLSPDATAESPAIAVLPFSVHGQELGIWREGMVDLLSMGLDGAGGLRAIDSRTLLARWSESVGSGVADLRLSLDVARRAGANYALVGSAVAAG